MKKIYVLIFGILSFLFVQNEVKADITLEYSFSNEFNQILRENYPLETSDGILTNTELKQINSLRIEGESLTRINYYDDSVHFDYALNGGEPYDSWCSKFPYLKNLVVKNTSLPIIMLNSCDRLESVDLLNNQKMEKVGIGLNKQLSSLVLPETLKEIYISRNYNIQNINLSNFSKLEKVGIFDNYSSFQTMISNNPLLKEVTISNNTYLNKLKITENDSLSTLEISSNESINSIDISNNKELYKVEIGDNFGIQKLNLSTNKSLKDLILYCNHNLNTINLTGNKYLEILSIRELTKLEELDLSNNLNLLDIAITYNDSLKLIKLPNSNLNVDFRVSSNGYNYIGQWYLNDTIWYENSDYLRLTGQILAKRTSNDSMVVYQTGIQKKGWLPKVIDGTTSGSVGKGLRMEALKVNLKNQEFSGNIEYRTHIQKKGWESTWKKNGATSGTEGLGLRLEAVQIRLTGEMAKYYDIYYRIHSQRFGWLDWTKNGASAGTAGFGFRVEAVQIKLVKKGSAAPGSTKRPFVSYDATGVTYQTQVQKKGWLTSVSNGETSGTVGQGLRMESLKINLKNQGFSGNIEYRTHIQKKGWESTWKKNGTTSGTVGLGLRLEALQLRLTGNMAKEYDIYYRVQAQKFGWLGWAKNGESAGTAGFGYRLEAIQIVLVRKGMTPPGSTANHFYSK